MNFQKHQQELEAYYRQQIGGRAVFWKDKYKPYLSLYRDRLLKRNAAIAAALPKSMECAVDIGCGQGDLLVALAQRAKLAIGLDFAEVMAQTARQNLQALPNVRVLCSPAEYAPIRDQSADAIVLADVIEHLVEPLECLRECKRLLKPGGIAVVTTPNAPMENFWKRVDSALNAPFQLLRLRKRNPMPPMLERLYSRKELAALVAKAGLEVCEHRLIEFYPGAEGGGVFGRILRILARQKHARQWLVEPVFRALFAGIERLQSFNNRQFLVIKKPAQLTFAPQEGEIQSDAMAR